MSKYIVLIRIKPYNRYEDKIIDCNSKKEAVNYIANYDKYNELRLLKSMDSRVIDIEIGKYKKC